jgi:hypothetical protein
VKKQRLLLPVFALLGTVAVLVTSVAIAAAGAEPKKRAHPKVPVRIEPKKRHINPLRVRRLRRTALRWQSVMGVRRASYAAPLHTAWALRYWRRQVRIVSRQAANPPHKRGWLCIHRFEGSWRDSNDPYWGGLQMDRSFMRSYAPAFLLRRGWANRWTPLEQMWVAERAHRSGRGYYPWPNTARYCGLI